MITWIVLVLLKWLVRYVVGDISTDLLVMKFHCIFICLLEWIIRDLTSGLLKDQIGTDIEDFKCSWLVVKALECCNEEQRKVLNVSQLFHPTWVILCFGIMLLGLSVCLSPGELRESRWSMCCKSDRAIQSSGSSGFSPFLFFLLYISLNWY